MMKKLSWFPFATSVAVLGCSVMTYAMARLGRLAFEPDFWPDVFAPAFVGTTCGYLLVVALEWANQPRTNRTLTHDAMDYAVSEILHGATDRAALKIMLEKHMLENRQEQPKP